MPNASVRASARTLPKKAKSLADQISAKSWILDELTAAEAKLREARTKAEEGGTSATPQGRPEGFDARLRGAYMDLEPDIWELRQMASIVEALFEDVFKASTSKDGWYAFHITDEAFERLRFAVFRTSSMASDLDVAYLKTFEEARTHERSH